MTSDYVKANQASQSLPGAGFAELMAAVLDKKVPVRFTAPGFSMTPFIRDGDTITIAPVSEKIRCGDVVAFMNPCRCKLTVHRIVNISSKGYLIKGDNMSEPDACVQRSSIIGRVVQVEHRSRQVRWGLGIERIIIAFLSRREWLTPMMWTVWRFIKPVAGRWIG
jgi:signal peptidase I